MPGKMVGSLEAAILIAAGTEATVEAAVAPAEAAMFPSLLNLLR